MYRAPERLGVQKVTSSNLVGPTKFRGAKTKGETQFSTTEKKTKKMSADTSADKKRAESLPGTLWKSHGTWHWRVKLPGEEKRKDRALTLPFSAARIPADDSTRSLAESAAWRMWECAERQAAGGAGAPVFTVNDLCGRWIAHASEYYAESREAVTMSCGMRLFRKMFGNRPAESMTHPDMIRYRDALVAEGYVRTTVNKYVGFVKRMATWATDERLMSPQLKAELTAMSPLKPHRSKAREGEQIRAVPAADIEATCKWLAPSLADMVRVHRLCGARPDEICQLNWQGVEQCGKVLVFRPRHKNEWRNKPRVVVFGPKAQAILEKYRGEDYVFSPQMAVMEHYEKAIADAKCHRPPEKVKGIPRKAGERWTVDAYNRAVSRACERAGVDRWSPNQLRHTCATEVRRRFGIEAASAVLGHSLGLRITDRYSFEAAEDEMIKAATPAMLRMG